MFTRYDKTERANVTGLPRPVSASNRAVDHPAPAPGLHRPGRNGTAAALRTARRRATPGGRRCSVGSRRSRDCTAGSTRRTGSWERRRRLRERATSRAVRFVGRASRRVAASARRGRRPGLGNSPAREAGEDLADRVSLHPLVGRHLAPQRRRGAARGSLRARSAAGARPRTHAPRDAAGATEFSSLSSAAM
jgi:hypothetical protein